MTIKNIFYFLKVKKICVVALTLMFCGSFLPFSIFAQEEEEEYYCEIPHSHVVGDQCYCDDGYVNYNGKCRTPEAVCRSLNARYNAAIQECECRDGFIEQNDYCVEEGEEITLEQSRAMEENKDLGDTEELPVKQKSDNNIDRIKTESDSDKIAEKSMVDEKFDVMMEEYYSKYDPEIQEVIKENVGKIEKIQEDEIEPRGDIYSDIISGSDDEQIIIAPFEIPIKESFEFLNKDEKEEAEDQMEVISDFTNAGSEQEFSLKKDEKDVLEYVREDVANEELNKKTKEWSKKTKEWEENLEKAQKEGKIKEGFTKEEFETEEEMEGRLKWQIATIKKAIGFEHLRIIETTGIVKMDKMHQPISFGTMSADYKKYYGNKSAVDDNEWSSQGVTFNNSVRNITGMNKQLKDLKKALKKEYPKGWKQKYLDVPEKPKKPTLEEQEKEIEKVGLFNFIESKSE